jgi:hypothetical protein
MTQIELEYLIACYDSVVLRRPLLASLAASLNVPANELYYLWAARQCPQRGTFQSGEWAYFFHGCECDVRHPSDGRFVRIDFAPHGNTEAFSTWAVAQFIMASTAPWPQFTGLKTFLAEGGAPCDRRSASIEKAATLTDRLESAGLIKTADPELLAFAERHTVPNGEGIPVLRLPTGFSERRYFDILVAGRKLISEAGLAQISSANDLVPACTGV